MAITKTTQDCIKSLSNGTCLKNFNKMTKDRKEDTVLQVVALSSFSGLLVSDVFEEEAQKLKELTDNPFIAFQKEFLRWMLSDGASAFLLSDKPNEKGLSLEID